MHVRNVGKKCGEKGKKTPDSTRCSLEIRSTRGTTAATPKPKDLAQESKEKL